MKKTLIFVAILSAIVGGLVFLVRKLNETLALIEEDGTEEEEWATTETEKSPSAPNGTSESPASSW